MFYTYVLLSQKNESYYIGSTSDLRKRFSDHNEGRSKYTAKFRPWKLIYYEAFVSKSLAIEREYSLKKRAKSWQELTKRLGIER